MSAPAASLRYHSTVSSSASSRLISGRQPRRVVALAQSSLSEQFTYQISVFRQIASRISRARLDESLEAKRQLHADLDGLAQTIRSQQAQTKEIVARQHPVV